MTLIFKYINLIFFKKILLQISFIRYTGLLVVAPSENPPPSTIWRFHLAKLVSEPPPGSLPGCLPPLPSYRGLDMPLP